VLPEYFIYLAALINAVASIVYTYATLRGETQPNRVSWFMWAVAPLIATAAQMSAGVGLPSLIVFVAGFGPLIVFVASFINKKSYWRTTVFDYMCGILALCALLFWYLTKDPDVAIVFSILSDFFALIPTARKAYFHPESENGPTYILALLSVVIGVLSIQQYNFAAYAFTGYMTMMSVVLCSIIYRRRLRDLFFRSKAV
jgi:hypothetical protein